MCTALDPNCLTLIVFLKEFFVKAYFESLRMPAAKALASRVCSFAKALLLLDNAMSTKIISGSRVGAGGSRSPKKLQSYQASSQCWAIIDPKRNAI